VLLLALVLLLPEEISLFREEVVGL